MLADRFTVTYRIQSDAASIGARSAEIGASPSGYRHVGSAADGHRETPLDLFAYPMMRLLVAAVRSLQRGPRGAPSTDVER